jgi:hypothetical protein
MIEGRSGEGFALEALTSRRIIIHLWMQRLQRNVAAQL